MTAVIRHPNLVVSDPIFAPKEAALSTIQHLVVFKMKDGLEEEHRATFVARIDALREEIPQIRSLRVLHGAELRPDSADYVMFMEFATATDFATYMAHPAHRAFSDDCARPWTETRIAFQTLDQ